MQTETLEDTEERGPEAATSLHPGVVIVYAQGRPQHVVIPLEEGAVTLGRDELAAAGLPDGRVSRRHVGLELAGDRWSVRDLGSRNGTFVDGEPARAGTGLVAPVVRIGRTLLIPVLDRRPHEARGVVARDGLVVGPVLGALHERIAQAARSGAGLLIHGPSGAGKELAAQVFHAGTGGRALVVVNCATIPKELAELILFGARRGAYTGAVSNTVGLVQAADHGTLFLDEIAELDAGVQAKLLRVLETRSVMPLGAVSPVEVAVRVCAATHKDLRVEVAEGRFRGDLYFRVGRPVARLPPLRERREEIPWLVEQAIAKVPGAAALTATAELVEVCLTRRWIGNVRELLAEVKIATIAALTAKRTAVAATDLDPEAGRTIEEPGAALRGEVDAPERREVEEALRAEHGNVTRAAVRLGIDRSRLRRLIDRHGIDVRALR